MDFISLIRGLIGMCYSRNSISLLEQQTEGQLAACRNGSIDSGHFCYFYYLQ